MKKIIILLLPLLLICCTTYSDKAQSNCNSDLITVTDSIRTYSNKIILPKINSEKNKLLKLLKIVNVLLDKEQGISTLNISPNEFMALSMTDKYNYIEKDKKEILIYLHNKYMLNDPSGIFFGPTADDIVKYKFAFGCTHYARAFMAIVKSLDIIRIPENMRYAVSCNSTDYNKYLLSELKEDKTINGHQFVIVRIDNKWYAINTNRINDYITFPDNFTPDMNILQTNYPISFNKIENKIFLLRKIGKNFNDNCNDKTFQNLMNIYISGNPNSSIPKWNKYK